MVGAELRRYRNAAGLSLADLARRVHYSRGHLSRIENGRHVAGVELIRRCDAALGAGGRLAALAEPPAGSVPLGAGECDGDTWVMGMTADGTGWAVPMSRREALSGGVSSWLGLQLAPVLPSNAAALRPVLDGFWDLYDQVRRLGQLAGPGMVLPMVLAQTQVVRGMAAGAGAPERAELLRLAARYAEFGGWMAQESGDDRIALACTRDAVSLASAAGDRELTAHACVRQALITLYAGDAAQTVELAGRARFESGVSARIRGLAALRVAQGYAVGGDENGCRKALDKGRELLDEARGETGEPLLGPTTVTDMTAVVAGWCEHDLGRPGRAVDILVPEFNRISETSRRARARYGCRLALAYLGTGEVGLACSLLEDLIADIEVVDSATIRADLRRCARSLPYWRSNSHARDLSARLPAVLRVRIPQSH
jgi:DNA-binding XRE family transcriptional regulator